MKLRSSVPRFKQNFSQFLVYIPSVVQRQTACSCYTMKTFLWSTVRQKLMNPADVSLVLLCWNLFASFLCDLFICYFGACASSMKKHIHTAAIFLWRDAQGGKLERRLERTTFTLMRPETSGMNLESLTFWLYICISTFACFRDAACFDIVQLS